MSDQHQHYDRTIYGVAALSLLEAVILTLVERGVIGHDDLDDAFLAAIDAHRNHGGDHDRFVNQQTAQFLERLHVHGNSVRLDYE